MSKHTPGPWRIECFEVTAGPPDPSKGSGGPFSFEAQTSQGETP